MTRQTQTVPVLATLMYTMLYSQEAVGALGLPDWAPLLLVQISSSFSPFFQVYPAHNIGAFLLPCLRPPFFRLLFFLSKIVSPKHISGSSTHLGLEQDFFSALTAQLL